jgi:hypothetical protein
LKEFDQNLLFFFSSHDRFLLLQHQVGQDDGGGVFHDYGNPQGNAGVVTACDY